MTKYDLSLANERLVSYIDDFKSMLSEEQISRFNLIMSMSEELSNLKTSD